MRKLAAVPVSGPQETEDTLQIAGIAGPTGSGTPNVTVTLAPDCLPQGVEGPDGAVPLVGYLVLAPAGTQLSQLAELLSAPAPTNSRRDQGADQHDATADGAPRSASREHTDAAAPAEARTPGATPGRTGLDIDLDRRTVTVDGRPLNLTYLEFELLAHLARHPNRVYTREHLVATIWGYGPVGEQRTVDVHIARLRRKLGPAYRDRIVTIRRVGYKYVPGPPATELG